MIILQSVLPENWSDSVMGHYHWPMCPRFPRCCEPRNAFAKCENPIFYLQLQIMMLLFLNIYHFHMNVFPFRACMFFQCFFFSNYIPHFFCIICYGFCSNKCYKKQKTKLSGHVADRTLPSALQTQPDGGEYPAASSSNRWIRAHRLSEQLQNRRTDGSFISTSSRKS